MYVHVQFTCIVDLNCNVTSLGAFMCLWVDPGQVIIGPGAFISYRLCYRDLGAFVVDPGCVIVGQSASTLDLGSIISAQRAYVIHSLIGLVSFVMYTWGAINELVAVVMYPGCGISGPVAFAVDPGCVINCVL